MRRSQKNSVKARKAASPPPSDGRAGVGALAFLPLTLVLTACSAPPAEPRPGPAGAVRFVNVAREAGVVLPNVTGATDKSTINETVGNGACLYDVDDDGRIDIFLPNGSRGAASPAGSEPRSALYRNRGDGTFEDETEKAGVASSGYWAQGCVFGDYDDDGHVDLFLTGFGRYILYHNLGDGRFLDATLASGLRGRGWSTGAAFGDYDGDGRIDLYVSHYVDYDAGSPPLPQPGSGVNCFYRGVPVICGPRGLKPSFGRLFHNEGGGRFRDVSRALGPGADAGGYGLGAVWSDLDLDGDLDLFVANDSTPNRLYRNDGGGRFTEIGALAGAAYNEEGRVQAGMGVDSGDYDNDGRFDLVVTNFSHDYTTLRHNERDLFFLDVSMDSGLGAATLPTLGWGVGFLDYDNDGFKDLFLANGHVFPGIDRSDLGTTWKQRNQLFRNDGSGRFLEVTDEAGPGLQETHSARGAAFGDLDDDGDIDVVVNNIDEPPSLLRNDGGSARSWIGFHLVGTGRNLGAVGARLTVTSGSLQQIGEIHAGSSHNSSSDPRLHFGLGARSVADRVEIRWPLGRTQTLTDLPAGRYHTIREPAGS
jgi:enediyne biosynthesis protein E4